jgi:hypothetical protein
MTYFAARHAAIEHLALVNVQINGRNIGTRGFEFHLLRSARDLPGRPSAVRRQGRSELHERPPHYVADERDALERNRFGTHELWLAHWPNRLW